MRHVTVVLSALVLGACVAGEDYQRPTTAEPRRWSEASGPRVVTGSTVITRWWSEFGDPTLNSLVARACAANLDLKSATARIRESRARAGRARADRFPEIDAFGDVSRQRSSENVDGPSPGGESNLYRAGFDARWELDVFGGTRRSIEAADAEIEASIQDRRAVLVTLLAEVAQNYIELRGNQKLAAVSRQNIAAARDTVQITGARLDGGLGTRLDVSRAEALLAATEAVLPQYQAAIRVAIHRLSILLAEPPSSLANELEVEGAIPKPPERVLVGIPSELLERRPDVRRAERLLAAACARIGEAKADRYPRFSLTSSFGLDSSSSANFADAASRAWSMGPSVRWPLFAGGRIESTIAVQDARAEQAEIAYRQAMLTALEDVENALVGYLREWDHQRSLEVSVAANRKSVEIANNLFTKGVTTFLDVLEAERNAYQAELEFAQSQSSTSLRVVALYKALGGGWETGSGLKKELEAVEAMDAAPQSASSRGM